MTYSCTKNNDQDELEHPTIQNDILKNQINESKGYFDKQIKAILYWNKMILNFHNNSMKCLQEGNYV